MQLRNRVNDDNDDEDDYDDEVGDEEVGDDDVGDDELDEYEVDVKEDNVVNDDDVVNDIKEALTMIPPSLDTKPKPMIPLTNDDVLQYKNCKLQLKEKTSCNLA